MQYFRGVPRSAIAMSFYRSVSLEGLFGNRVLLFTTIDNNVVVNFLF